MKTYPCIGNTYKVHRRNCQICRQAKAVVRIDVEVNYFRGDDEVFRACEKCRLLSAEDMLAFGRKDLVKP